MPQKPPHPPVTSTATPYTITTRTSRGAGGGWEGGGGECSVYFSRAQSYVRNCSRMQYESEDEATK
eukprot:4654787-Pyramimonas_sp.AAC.1